MRRSISEKMMMMMAKSKKVQGNCFEGNREIINDNNHNKRFLISVNVLGSAGPLRFLVNEEDLVGGVIDTALKAYAKEGRFPVLGSRPHNFILYCAKAGSDALSQWEEIGACGARTFVLCKKPEQRPNMTEARSDMISRKRNGSWKAWLNKSLSFKISSH